jgi:hypothetical protein
MLSRIPEAQVLALPSGISARPVPALPENHIPTATEVGQETAYLAALTFLQSKGAVTYEQLGHAATRHARITARRVAALEKLSEEAEKAVIGAGAGKAAAPLVSNPPSPPTPDNEEETLPRQAICSKSPPRGPAAASPTVKPSPLAQEMHRNLSVPAPRRLNHRWPPRAENSHEASPPSDSRVLQISPRMHAAVPPPDCLLRELQAQVAAHQQHQLSIQMQQLRVVQAVPQQVAAQLAKMEAATGAVSALLNF